MKLYKVFFFKLIKIVCAIAIIASIVACIFIAKNNQQGKEISEKEFIKKVQENRIDEFNSVAHLVLEIQLPSGEKFSHQFKSEDELERFKNLMTESWGDSYSGSYSISTTKVTLNDYLLAVGIIFWVAFLVIAFYAVFVLWFVSLFDLLKSEFTENHNKWIWLICHLLLPFVAPIFYVFIAEKQKSTNPATYIKEA